MTTRILSCLLLFICFLFLPAHTQAAVQPSVRMCFSTAGKMYQIDPLLLEAIARHESGLNPRAMNLRNRNGTVDYGLMQVNSSHIPLLKQKGIIRNPQDLLDPCLN
ncbi:lytic transglycosylase domain-containing protein, partial [Escherichia coli]